ncbi:MAG: hypothetical protein OXU20_20190 [Myxococcales bacterium]|nr:hypothetical protein [Myxococcales bacterium]
MDSTQKPGQAPRVLRAAALLALGFAAGQLSRSHSSATSLCPEERDDSSVPTDKPRRAAARTPKQRPLKRNFVTRPMELYPVAGSGAEDRDRYQTEQARDVMKLVRTQLKLKQKLAPPGSLPEATAMLVAPWLAGLADGLFRTGPDLVSEMAGQVETSVCDANTDDAELITMSLLMKAVPELASPETFECALSRPQEDAVLWHALDAFTLSGLPTPDAMAELKRRAADPRTRRRLMTQQERMATLEAARSRRTQAAGVAPDDHNFEQHPSREQEVQ